MRLQVGAMIQVKRQIDAGAVPPVWATTLGVFRTVLVSRPDGQACSDANRDGYRDVYETFGLIRWRPIDPVGSLRGMEASPSGREDHALTRRLLVKEPIGGLAILELEAVGDQLFDGQLVAGDEAGAVVLARFGECP